MDDKQLEKALNRNKIKIHISQDLINNVETSEQEIITGFNSAGRPEGIWFSYGGSWLKFLSDNTGNMKEEYKSCCYLYNVVLSKKILKLNTIAKLNKFDTNYPSYWRPASDIKRGSSYLKRLPYVPVGRSMGVRRNVERLIRDGKIITSLQEVKDEFEDEYGIVVPNKDIEYYKFKRWDLIAKKYNGVEFIPYFENYRKKRFWYWTIDVASGCVWNPNGVKEFKLLAKKTSDDKWDLTNYGKKILI